MNAIFKMTQTISVVLLVWAFPGACSVCFAQDANGAAPAQDKWENSVLAVPFQCEKGAPEQDGYVALAAHNVVENMLALHNGLDERWASWTLAKDYPSEEALRDYVIKGGAPPAEIFKEKARYFLFGRVTSSEARIEVRFEIEDRSIGRKYDKVAVLDEPGLQGFRTIVLDLLDEAGIRPVAEQRSKMLWREDLPAESLAVDGQVLWGNYTSVYRKGHRSLDGEPFFQKAVVAAADSYLLLNNIGWVFCNAADYSRAREFFQKALALNPVGADAADGMIACAGADRDEAAEEKWTARKAEIQSRDGKFAAAQMWNRRGDAAYDKKDFAKAIDCYRKAIEFSPLEVAFTTNLAYALSGADRFDEAERLIADAGERLSPDAKGKLEKALADLLGRQLLKLLQLGQYRQAIPLWEKSIALTEKALGPEHPDTASSLDGMGRLYEAVGVYSKAESLFQRALKIREKALGPKHRDTATSLNNLARLYQDMKDYAKAEPLFQRALEIREEVLGPEHPDTAQSLNNLALLYQDMRDYVKAESRFQRALEIRERVLGPEHSDTAQSLNNLALFYQNKGDYAKAEPLLQRALRIREKALGPLHPHTAATLNGLALLYYSLGDYAKAETLCQTVLNIQEVIRGPDHPQTAISLNNLAGFYSSRGEYAKAEPLFQRALKIQEKVLGPEHPDTAASVSNLAMLYLYMGDYAKAEGLFERALNINEKVRGAENPYTADNLMTLGAVYQCTGDYAKAEPLFQRALNIREKVLRPDHRDTALSLFAMALLKLDLGRIDEARAFAQRAKECQVRVLANILSFCSEGQRLAYAATMISPYTLFAAGAGNDYDVALAAFRYKGVVLDSIIEDRQLSGASTDAAQAGLLDQLNADKLRLDRLLLETAPEKPSGDVSEQTSHLEQEVEQIEGQLARNVASLGHARRALDVTIEKVQAAIPKDGALVEYLRYRHYLGKAVFEPRYGAIVLTSNGQPKWIPLGKAQEIEELVVRYKNQVRDDGIYDQVLAKTLRTLAAQIWAPVRQALPGNTRMLIISPDSQLNFVSFATLLDEGDRFLAENYAIHYVSTGRDLLREVKVTSNSEALVFANPEFANQPGPLVAKNEPERGAFRGNEKRGIMEMGFGPLKGTQQESDKLAEKFKEWKWNAPTAFVRGEASKEALLKVKSPYILHLATHGFFAPEAKLDSLPEREGAKESNGAAGRRKFFDNPMHCSGLALAGAQTTIEAWRRGETPPWGNDGIVTAEDVSTLKLNGTWLATLSACDTGSGEAKAGEGVLGLRRGFIEAGVIHLLMTLWPIRDEVTVNIMLDFYEAAHKSGDAPRALAEVQRDWLVKLRKEKGLFQAVSLAGPFIMSSQGKP